MNTTQIALEIMAKGMGGIFAAAIIIIFAIMILQKITAKK